MATPSKAMPDTHGRFLERIEGETEATIDPRLVALTLPHGAAAESYRMLLHRLRRLRAARGESALGGSVIAVTSSVRGEGVSLSAANLALTAARAGDSRVALVDCDLRRGSSAALFGLGERSGLSELLQGKCEVGEVLGQFDNGHMAVIGAGRAPAEPAALLSSSRFSSLLHTLRSMFDEIILDVPPALATADAAIVSSRSDGVVLVVRAGQTPRERVLAATRALAGSPVLGVLLNGVDPRQVPPPMPVVDGRLALGPGL